MGREEEEEDDDDDDDDAEESSKFLEDLTAKVETGGEKSSTRCWGDECPEDVGTMAMERMMMVVVVVVAVVDVAIVGFQTLYAPSFSLPQEKRKKQSRTERSKGRDDIE